MTLIFPDFANASNSQQRKIIDCFKPVEYLPGQYIIKEGESGNLAFLIKEGNCIFQSTRNPLLESAGGKKARQGKPMDVALRTKRGFLSSTTSIYQFGILEKNQWAGEERILRSVDEPAGYSIIAKTNVKAFCISKEDAKKKFTKEIMEYLVSIVEQRYMWLRERANYLSQASFNVANMDPSDIKYDENLAELTKKFPVASSYVLTNIRKKALIAKSLSTERPSLPIKTTSPKYAQMLTHTLSNGCFSARDETSKNATQFPKIFSTRTSLLSQNASGSPSPNMTATTTGFVSPRKSLQMAMAASESRAVHSPTEGIFAPRLTKRLEKARTMSMEMLGRKNNAKNEEEKRNAIRFTKEMASKNLNKFVIGRRVIRLAETLYGRKPTTPNPFAHLAARAAAGASNGRNESQTENEKKAAAT